MKKILFGLMALLSISSYSTEINLWEENTPLVSMGYTGFELSGRYVNKSLKNVNEFQKFLDETYSIRNTVNESLREKALADSQEKDWILNLDISYLKYEDMKTPIYSINYGILDDVTRYGINFSVFNGESKFKEDYDTKGGQLNLYFNRMEELGSFFGTLYIGRNKQDLNKNIDNLYYGYNQYFEQKYESFDVDEFYSGYFLNLDISRVETDYKRTQKVSKNNDSINPAIGILFEKRIYFAEDSQVSIELASSIGKEFKEEDKYKDLGKDEFEFYNSNKLEITTNVGTSANIFTGIEYKKSITNSNSENNIYVGFKINF